jgi:Asp-tRNA(Asn)/Glu-tRNA(Gln) amidotransferase A subunit family amidase
VSIDSGSNVHWGGGLTVERARRAIAHDNARLRALLLVIDPPLRDPSVADDAPLAGVPYSLKDTWDVEGYVTTGGSWRHRARVSGSSSTIARALQKAGAVLVGKSNLSDLAFAGEATSYVGGRTLNPSDPSRTAGGSSGGAAAAVASGMAVFDWGGDFGGSIRMPAACCGVVGLRLSSEAWPLEGQHFPRSPDRFRSMLGWGPLARTVDDCARVVNAVRAVAPELRVPIPLPQLGSKVVLYPPDRKTTGAWKTFAADVTRALDRAGVPYTTDHDLPPPSEATQVFNRYLCAHFGDLRELGELTLGAGWSAFLLGLASGGRLDRRLHPVSGLNFILCEIGNRTLYRDVVKADRQRQQLIDAAKRTFREGGLIVSPTLTWPAPRHGRAELTPHLQAFCKLGNLIDATAIAVPFGTFDDGLPRSVQVMGPPGSEQQVLALARKLEAAYR